MFKYLITLLFLPVYIHAHQPHQIAISTTAVKWILPILSHSSQGYGTTQKPI